MIVSFNETVSLPQVTLTVNSLEKSLIELKKVAYAYTTAWYDSTAEVSIENVMKLDVYLVVES